LEVFFDGLEGVHHARHTRSLKLFLLQALDCELRNLPCSLGGTLGLETGVQDLGKLGLVFKKWLGPAHEILLVAEEGGVEAVLAGKKLKQNYAETPDVSLGVRLARLHYLKHPENRMSNRTNIIHKTD